MTNHNLLSYYLTKLITFGTNFYLILFNFLFMRSVVLLLCFLGVGLISCNKEEVVPESSESSITTVSLDELTLSDLSTENSFRANSALDLYKVHRSKGSISDDGTLKKLKWDISFDAETREVSGATGKYIFKNRQFSFDLDIKSICTCIVDNKESRAINVLEISKINDANNAGSIIKEGNYIAFVTEDGSKVGNPDKYPRDINVFNRNNLLRSLAQFNFARGEKDICPFLADIFKIQDDFKSNAVNIPSDDWLRIRGVN